MNNIIKKYPELDELAKAIANQTCAKINNGVEGIKSEARYKAQYTLEEVIKILESRV